MSIKNLSKRLENEYAVIKYPLSTEKSLRLMESNNTLVFIVEKKAKKPDIKKAIEKMFSARIKSVNTLVGMDGKKRAYIKFSDDTPAIDIATQLGLM